MQRRDAADDTLRSSLEKKFSVMTTLKSAALAEELSSNKNDSNILEDQPWAVQCTHKSNPNEVIHMTTLYQCTPRSQSYNQQPLDWV